MGDWCLTGVSWAVPRLQCSALLAIQTVRLVPTWVSAYEQLLHLLLEQEKVNKLAQVVGGPCLAARSHGVSHTVKPNR